MITSKIISGTIAMIASAGVTLGNGSVTLRGNVTLAAGQIHLADIADLNGPEALAIGDVVVSSGASRNGTRITLEEITTVLGRTSGVNLGKLTFHGSSCTATLPSPKAIEPAAPVPIVPTGPVVRDMVPRRVADLLGVEPQKLRLKFDESDTKLLNQATSGRVVELKPIGAADRVPLQISIYEDRGELGHTLVASGIVRVGVDVLRDVIVMKAQLKKGDAITADNVMIDQQWLGFASKPSAVDIGVGSIVRASRLNPGQAVMESDIEQAVIVKRGQLVTVHCITGTFVIKTQARALESGKVGDVIKFAPVASKDKKDVRSFEARLEAPGRAIMTVSGSTLAPRE